MPFKTCDLNTLPKSSIIKIICELYPSEKTVDLYAKYSHTISLENNDYCSIYGELLDSNNTTELIEIENGMYCNPEIHGVLDKNYSLPCHIEIISYTNELPDIRYV